MLNKQLQKNKSKSIKLFVKKVSRFLFDFPTFRNRTTYRQFNVYTLILQNIYGMPISFFHTGYLINMT
jgi:hypothetical protein